MEKRFRADSKCPSCGRYPAVRFSEEEVRRCRIDRQRGNHTHARCTGCGTGWWILTGEIGRATPERSPNGRRPSRRRSARKGGKRQRPKRGTAAEGSGGLPKGFPGRAQLAKRGITELDALRKIDDLTAIPGIGVARAKQISIVLKA